MRRSDNLNFWSVSKTKAAMMFFILLGVGILLSSINGGVACSGPFYGMALLYGGRWLFCHNRDKKAAVEAELARQQYDQATLEAPKTTPRRGLYIPNDHD